MKMPNRDKASGRWLRATDNDQYRGRQYGRLKVLDIDWITEKAGNTKRYALYHCTYGNLHRLSLSSLIRKEFPTRSCGCLRREICYNGR